MTKSLKRKAEKVITALCCVIVAVLLLFVGYLSFCNMSGRVPFVGNRAVLKIISPSMEPLIPTGSYIYAKKITPENAEMIKNGDIIVFISRDPAIYGKLNTHRVIEVRGDGDSTEYITKGDNNNIEDSLSVSRADIVGLYIKNLPVLSGAAGFISQKWVFFTLIIIPSAILLTLSVIDFAKKSKQVKIDRLVAREVERMKQNNINSESDSDSDI